MRNFNIHHFLSKNQISLIINIFPKDIIKEISNIYNFQFTMEKKLNKKQMASKVSAIRLEQEIL